MGPCPQFPYLDILRIQEDPSFAAEQLVGSYLEGLYAWEICEAKRKALIDWINESP
jgi:hypothetical protein